MRVKYNYWTHELEAWIFCELPYSGEQWLLLKENQRDGIDACDRLDEYGTCGWLGYYDDVDDYPELQKAVECIEQAKNKYGDIEVFGAKIADIIDYLTGKIGEWPKLHEDLLELDVDFESGDFYVSVMIDGGKVVVTQNGVETYEWVCPGCEYNEWKQAKLTVPEWIFEEVDKLRKALGLKFPEPRQAAKLRWRPPKLSEITEEERAKYNISLVDDIQPDADWDVVEELLKRKGVEDIEEYMYFYRLSDTGSWVEDAIPAWGMLLLALYGEEYFMNGECDMEYQTDCAQAVLYYWPYLPS